MSIRASLVYILWYLIALHKTAELFRLSGKPSAARRLSKAAQALRQALKKLVQADGLIGDGISDAGKRVRATSIHAQTLASMAGFEMGREKPALSLCRAIPATLMPGRPIPLPT